MKNIFKKITSILLIILTFVTCGNVKTIKAESGYYLTETEYYYDLFDITPLTPYHVGFLKVTTPDGITQAFCVDPFTLTHEGDEYVATPRNEDEMQNLAQVVLTYNHNYRENPLYGTSAGYYSAQLAIWGRIRGVDPDTLTIKAGLTDAQIELANKVKALATDLYRNAGDLATPQINFLYNRENKGNSFTDNLTNGNFSLYDINGTLYYRSKEIALTTSGMAGGLEYTVNVDNGAFVTDSAQDLSGDHRTSITLGGSERGNAFYVFVPATEQAGEVNVNISANYKFPNIMVWTHASGDRSRGQTMISEFIDNGNVTYSAKLTHDAWNIPIEETEYKGTFTIKKRGDIVSDYVVSTADNQDLYTLVTSEQRLGNAYFGILEEKDSGMMEPIGNTLYRTSENGDMTVSFNLTTLSNGKLPLVNVCEVKAPDGYKLFDVLGMEHETDATYGTINCIQLDFERDKATADENKVITKNLPELKDEAKKFTVNVLKTDQNGNPLEGYNFGLYTTKEIKVAGRETIPAGSMVAYGTTNAEGKLTLVDESYFLPANQNYVIKELNGGDENTRFVINDVTTYGVSAIVDALDNEAIDGFNYEVRVENTIIETNDLKIIKKDQKTGELLSGATYSLSNADNIFSCTTGEDGSCLLEDVPYGTYTLNEVTAPRGYLLNETSQTVVINADTTEVVVTNLEEGKGKFTVKKEISGIETTSDAFEYKVEKVSGDDAGYNFNIVSTANTNTNVVAGNRKISPNTIDTYSFNFTEAGTYEFKVTENDCYYKESEAICSTNNGKWATDENEYNIKFIVDDEMDVKTLVNGEEVVSADIVFNNEYSLGRIKLAKIGKDSSTGAEIRLPGVQFELYKDDVLLETTTTNATGQLEWNDLVYGTYVIKETNTVDGYVLKTEPIEVTIDATHKELDLEVLNYHEAEVNVKINKVLTNIDTTTDRFDFVIKNEANPDDVNNQTISKQGQGSTTGRLKFSRPGTYEYTVNESLNENIQNAWGILTETQHLKVVVDNQMNVQLFLNGEEVEGNQFVLEFENLLNLPQIPIEIIKNYTYNDEVVDYEDVSDKTAIFEVRKDGEVISLTSITGNGRAQTQPLRFSAPGTYEYTIKEMSLNYANIETDPTVYNLKIKVQYKNNGQYEVEKTINDGNADSIVFNNKIVLNPIRVNMPITKVLEGESENNLTFTFTANEDLIQTIQAKKSPIATINFYKTLGEGEYEFYIKEKNLGETGVTYDNSRYIAKVKVERDGLELKSTVTYTKDGQPVDKITFNNKYVKPTTPSTPSTPSKPEPKPVDSCVSKGSDWYWDNNGVCRRRAVNTSTK